MAQYFFTRAAIEDLTAIWDYTVEEWSDDQAERYYLIIINGCQKIASKPLLGKKYFEIFEGLYGQHISKHIVFYRIINASTIEVERILHDSMDIESKFYD